MISYYMYIVLYFTNRGDATVLKARQKFFLTPHFLASGGGDNILLR